MPRLLRFSLVSFRDLLTTYAPVVLLVGGLLWIAYVAIDPTPPDKIVIAAGIEGSAYQDFAEKYRDILARHHIKVEIGKSEGSMQNFHGLNTAKSDADVAFVQSGTTNDEVADRRGLVSLGSLFVEPVWIFYREAALPKVKPMAPVATSPRVPQAVAKARLVKGTEEPTPPLTAITQLGELRGLSLNVGPKGSGGPRLANQLLGANRVDSNEIGLTYLEDTPAVMKLLDGSLDAVMFVTAREAPLVQMLLQTPGIKLFNFDQAEAYSRRFTFLKHVVLPRGIVALEKDIPHEDVHLIAPTATLVAKASTHPAIIELLMQAVTEVHGGAGWFGHAGEFPNDQYTEVPVSPVAERYYKSGPPFLQRYLPFWLANLIERMGVIIVPLLALLIPVSRILPPLYTWRVRSRVYRWYGQLREVENDVDNDPPKDEPEAVKPAQAGKTRDTRRTKQLARLAIIEARVNHLVVPLSYANELYTLKLHIDRVRDKLLAASGHRATRTNEVAPEAEDEPEPIPALS
jgi:TRAP-type uncharacterized transport system substrate-binding protein